MNAINFYLAEVYYEAKKRGYSFGRDKVQWDFTQEIIRVTDGQVLYETKHLLGKLEYRDPERHVELQNKKSLTTHPLFQIIPGEIESWEVLSKPEESKNL